MLAQRTFRIVWVAPGHGVGRESTATTDAEIHYTGDEGTASAPR